MTWRATETSAFRLSRQAADCLKIEFLIKIYILYFYFKQINFYFQNKKYFFIFYFLFLEKINFFNLNFLFLDSRRPADSAKTLMSRRPARSYLRVKKFKDVQK
jgi:hypothetical protein